MFVLKYVAASTFKDYLDAKSILLRTKDNYISDKRPCDLDDIDVDLPAGSTVRRIHQGSLNKLKTIRKANIIGFKNLIQIPISIDIEFNNNNNVKNEYLLIRGGDNVSTTSSLYSEISKKLSSLFDWFVQTLFGIEKKKKYGKKEKTETETEKNKKKKVSSSPSSSSSTSSGRIQKEMQQFLKNPPSNCKLTVGKNLRQWVITLSGVDGTVFAGEEYKLRVNFPSEYPTKPPSVYFLKPCPKHQHVYSNGDICLNLLGRDWRPTITVEALAVSILSMLSSAKEKAMPQDNAMHSDSAPGQQQHNWMYHDDKC
jgi:ubiquitin-conjugating enzyme E2 W